MKLKQFIFVGVMTAIFIGSQADYDCDEFIIKAEWHNVSDPANTLTHARNVLGRVGRFDDMCEPQCMKKSKRIFDMDAVSRNSIPALCSSLCDCPRDQHAVCLNQFGI